MFFTAEHINYKGSFNVTRNIFANDAYRTPPYLELIAKIEQ